MAEVICKALKEHLNRQQGQGQELCRRALAVVGRFSSSCHDVSREHDRELEGAYADTRE